MAHSKKHWNVVVREACKKSGTKEVDFGFLVAWQGQVDEPALRLALARFAARYSTALHVTNSKRILLLWVTEGPSRGWTAPSRTNEARATALQLTDLRRTLFHLGAERGMLLSSINSMWRSFVSLLEEFVATGVLPSLDTKARCIRPVPASLTQIHREGDFRSVEELHTFLRSLLPSSEDGNENFKALNKAYAWDDPDVRRDEGAADDMSSQVALVQDPRGIAIAILYREHLRPATAAALARKDIATRIAPQFWIDFVDCITGPLPHGMHEIGQLVRQAETLVPTMRATVRFPALFA